MSRFDLSWQRQPTSRGWGDLAAIAVLLLLISDHGIPRLLLRHGLLIPLYIPIIYDLARGQGVLHTALSLRGWRVLGQASFSIFMWQLPAMIVAMGVFEFLLPDFPSLWALLILVAGTVLWSVLSAYRFEQPIAKRLRALGARN